MTRAKSPTSSCDHGAASRPATPPASAPSLTQTILTLAVIVLLTGALLAAQIHAMAARGPWYDEFYTFYVTSRQFGWPEALSRHWLADNHPPLFYALSRATDWLGDTIEARRRVNLLAEVAAFAVAALALRRAGTRHLPLAAGFLAFLVAQGPAIVSAAELRSYFVSFAASALTVLLLTTRWLDGPFHARDLGSDRPSSGRPRPDSPRPDRRHQAALVAVLLVAFNTHIATSLICGATLALFIAAALLRRDLAQARALLWPGLVAGGILVAITAAQLPLWEANTRAFWIAPGFGPARWAIEMALIRALTANLLLTACGALGLLLLAADTLRRRQADRSLEAAVILGAGAAAALALALAIHLAWRPFIIERYLTALLPVLGIILALGCARVLRLAGRLAGSGAAAVLLLAIAALSLVTLVDHTRATIAKTTWAGTAAPIGAAAARCPDTAVHINPARWNADLVALAPADNAAVVPFAYRTMAARHGFTIEPAGSRRVSPTCPTLFWAEQGQRHRATAAEILRDVQTDGFPLHEIRVRRIGDGWVAAAK